MVVLGYIGALVMGMVLGLIGGGGSILTVPILVYLFTVDKVTATAYSLFIVGSAALVGSISHIRLGHISWKSALWFGAPSIIAVFATRAWIVPALPDHMGMMGLEFTKGTALMLLFAVLMLTAAIGMVRHRAPAKPAPARTPIVAFAISVLEGSLVGVLTGLVGAGGGFLIIPALVMFGGLGMKQAIGTSLVIIAAKSLLGFTGDLYSGLQADWPFLIACTATAAIGILLGTAISARVHADRLKPAFGWFVLVTGAAMIVVELARA